MDRSPQENEENHENAYFVQNNPTEKNSRKGKPIPGFAREIILKVTAICDQEAKDNVCKYPLNAPTKRAAAYTGVSERTIQRIRNTNKIKRNVESDECFKNRYFDDISHYNTIKKVSKRGQAIPNSARDIISKVIELCDREYKDGEYLEPLMSKSKRTAIYTGVSQRTVQRIRHEDQRRNQINYDKVLSTPGKRRKRCTFNDKIDDFDFHILRNIIDDLILVKGVNPTCSSLHTIIKTKLDFQYSEDTLNRLLHSKGFEWCKVNKGKRTLMEKPEVFKQRLDYMSKIKKQEILGKLVVYLDDMWINEMNYSDLCKNPLLISNGVCYMGRLVMLNEVSRMSFVKRVEKLLKPNISEKIEFKSVLATLFAKHVIEYICLSFDPCI